MKNQASPNSNFCAISRKCRIHQQETREANSAFKETVYESVNLKGVVYEPKHNSLIPQFLSFRLFRPLKSSCLSSE